MALFKHKVKNGDQRQKIASISNLNWSPLQMPFSLEEKSVELALRSNGCSNAYLKEGKKKKKLKRPLGTKAPINEWQESKASLCRVYFERTTQRLLH